MDFLLDLFPVNLALFPSDIASPTPNNVSDCRPYYGTYSRLNCFLLTSSNVNGILCANSKALGCEAPPFLMLELEAKCFDVTSNAVLNIKNKTKELLELCQKLNIS